MTDELQIIRVSGCVSDSNIISLQIVKADYSLNTIQFSCTIAENELTALVKSVSSSNTVVKVTKSYASDGDTLFTLGLYVPVSSKAINWYQPFVLNTTGGIAVRLSTKQEGK